MQQRDGASFTGVARVGHPGSGRLQRAQRAAHRSSAVCRAAGSDVAPVLPSPGKAVPYAGSDLLPHSSESGASGRAARLALQHLPGPPGPEPTLIGQWIAPGATTRSRGFAFAAPLRPGKAEAGKQFAHEAYVTRRDEFTESRVAKKLTREEVFLNETPMGDIIVYIEGQDPIDGNRQFAASDSAF